MKSIESQIEGGLLQVIAASADFCGGEWIISTEHGEECAEVVQSVSGDVFVHVPVSDPVSGNPVDCRRYRVAVVVTPIVKAV